MLSCAYFASNAAATLETKRFIQACSGHKSEGKGEVGTMRPQHIVFELRNKRKRSDDRPEQCRHLDRGGHLMNIEDQHR